MPQLSARVELPYLQPSQAQKHVTHNEALQRLDAVVQLTVQGFADETPPALPVEGDVHGLGAAPTGAWAGHAGDLAYWEGLAWVFITPQEGWRAWGIAEQELRILRAGNWEARTELQNLTLLGIGTAADTTNRLAVGSDAVLLSHNGAGHQVKVNKAAAGDTASLLFQSDWTGHAEIGLTGDTALSFKVSPDGQTWHTALRADPQAGQISFAPAGPARMVLSDSTMQLNLLLTGSAVQSSATDATAGRLLKTGAFGLGGTAPDLTSANEAVLGGTWRFEATDTDKPGPGDSAGVLWVAKWDATTVIQIAALHAPATQAGRMYLRILNGSWGPWLPLYTAANILGAVSQSGGVPTGAVLEKGSNANGVYTRFADGALICQRPGFSTANNAPVTWPFPSVFSGAPTVAGSCTSNALLRHLTTGARSATSVDVYSFDQTGSQSVSPACDLVAIGRWF